MNQLGKCLYFFGNELPGHAECFNAACNYEGVDVRQAWSYIVECNPRCQGKCLGSSNLLANKLDFFDVGGDRCLRSRSCDHVEHLANSILVVYDVVRSHWSSVFECKTAKYVALILTLSLLEQFLHALINTSAINAIVSP